MDRDLGPDDRQTLVEGVDLFLDSWKAHGEPLTVAREWRHDRFLLVGVDEASVPPSGCSIDALVNALKELEGRLGVTMVDNTPVWYRDGEGIQRVSRQDFGALVAEGRVTPASGNWHGRAFF